MNSIKSVKLRPGLYLVATPIGNLRDITLRALDVLASADLVICEDTRVSGKLLSAYDIKKPLKPYNDYSAEKQRGAIIEALSAGQAVALISDAGTPLISDPGYKLVRDCLDLDIYVTVIPGANAPLSALQLSALPTDKFSFLGFLPPKTAGRKKILQAWQYVPGSLVVFESGPRLKAGLADMKDTLGDRSAAVVREITKIYEESRRGRISDLIAYYEEEGAPKGEIVIVVEGAVAEEMSDDDVKAAIIKARETMSVKDASAYVAEQTGRPKKDIYEMALSLNEKKND